ncbi:dipeptide epimerase [Geitlerinema sp. PCC 7407]|uniref:dipeptide epimerase n=1 Tax=Geitlerinema sp. PCC 7407 TaxID=1173025 RepID=UPI00029FD167|nr:dipeptide epimerase [Geitlerinema sp. PCC 7407]AFY67195.1 Mandelate racemase/muconate lactonizing protein [Geitlerinema sp. PCC 7407]
MQVFLEPFTVHKRFALRISRGTTAESTNGWIRVQQDGIEGWGEATAFSIGEVQQTPEAIAASLATVLPDLERFHAGDRQAIEAHCREAGLLSAAWAGLDMALHDWLGKRVQLPLWRLWGLDVQRTTAPISVTIGISSPEAARERLRGWLEVFPARLFKVKLGSPEGIEADQAMFLAVQEEAPPGSQFFVDANGGWSLKDAIAMADWLSDRGVRYLEQPLARGQEADLPALYGRSPLPLFADESCFTSRDIPVLAGKVHGINIKLMKAGGLSEAQRMVHTARACGLQVMFGCYSDSALSNTAAAQLSPLADHLDLDSHLNLLDDPFSGARMQGGRLVPPDQPGLGVNHRAPEH